MLLFTRIFTGGLVGLTEVGLYVTSGNPPQTKAKAKSANVTVYNTEQLSANKIRVGLQTIYSLSQHLTTTINELYELRSLAVPWSFINKLEIVTFCGTW